jgi:hypothetical protein
MRVEYFKFEEEFIEEDVRCIPMIARFKLDACRIKLRLAEWSRMTVGERTKLAESPCTTREEIMVYREYVQQVVRMHSGQEASELRVDDSPSWAMITEIPALFQERLKEASVSVSLCQWQRLRTLQRFALMKLSSGGHESKNFFRALKEFNLV